MEYGVAVPPQGEREEELPHLVHLLSGRERSLAGGGYVHFPEARERCVSVSQQDEDSRGQHARDDTSRSTAGHSYHAAGGLKNVVHDGRPPQQWNRQAESDRMHRGRRAAGSPLRSDDAQYQREYHSTSARTSSTSSHVCNSTSSAKRAE